MISVVIPCYSNPEIQDRVGEQAWYTVASACSALEADGADYEVVVIMNGHYPMVVSMMHDGSRVKPIFCGAHIDSPQSARAEGVRQTRGDTIFFMDAHVVVPPNFFRAVLADMDATGADFMGTPHRFLGNTTFYGCHVAWEEYLWSRKTLSDPPLGPGKPWKAAIHPHGAFAMRRESYERAGGYWQALRKFGGEETQLCFKLWLMGMSVWVTSSTYHWHWLPPGGRRDSRIFKDENFIRNFLLVAAAYGGEGQVEASYNSMSMLHFGNADLFPMAKQQALYCEETEKEKRFVAERGKYRNIEELREMFKRSDVLS